jgi:hypothetical protein
MFDPGGLLRAYCFPSLDFLEEKFERLSVLFFEVAGPTLRQGFGCDLLGMRGTSSAILAGDLESLSLRNDFGLGRCFELLGYRLVRNIVLHHLRALLL